MKYFQELLDLRLPENDELSQWSVRRSGRARRLSVRVFHDGRVEVVAPHRASEAGIARFVSRHRDWIDRQLVLARERGPRADQPFPPETILLRAFGEAWPVHLADAHGAPSARLGRHGLLNLHGFGCPPREVAGALQLWLTEHARLRLGDRLDALARELGLEYAKLQLRRQRSRWGSCSTRGTISLNVCLAFQRPEVVRYLMIHELTHLEHMNHSARFWRAVELRCQGWRPLDRELLDGWRHVPAWVFA